MTSEAVRYPADLVPVNVLGRTGRFTVEVDCGREALRAHVANSGRIHELLVPGSPALLRRALTPSRQTAFDLVLVQVNGGWVSADSSLPNALVWEALEGRRIAALRGYADVRAEVRIDSSRVDFLLTGPEGRWLVEVKSVTLVEYGMARFPDAPSARALRHLQLLTDAVAEGDAACLIFVVQRSDATALRPNDAVDPAFGRALREAASKGVTLLAYRCEVSPAAIELVDEIPVQL